MDMDSNPRIKLHDTETLTSFLQSNRKRLMAFIKGQLGKEVRLKVEPDDIFQEMSAEAVRSLPTADLGERDPFPWLCKIAKSRIIDLYRWHFGAQKRDSRREVPLRSSRRKTDSLPTNLINSLVAIRSTPSHAFARTAREVKLHEALHRLPDMQRQAILMHFVEKRPSKEIAKTLGKTDGAVRVMLTRSIRRLKGLLHENESSPST